MHSNEIDISADELTARCIDLAYRVGRLQGRVDVWNSDVERTLEEMNEKRSLDED